jgi:hypothetical protein
MFHSIKKKKKARKPKTVDDELINGGNIFAMWLWLFFKVFFVLKCIKIIYFFIF